jgi:outer membrane protein TolC
MNRVSWQLAALALVAPLVAYADDEHATALLEQDVIADVIARNPTLGAALVDCRSASLNVVAEEARYGAVLAADSAYTHSASPALSPPSTVVTSTTDLFETGEELRKHLVWGTDLTLRADESVQASHQVFVLPSQLASVAGNGGGPLAVNAGPGYGAYVKLTVSQPLLRGAGRKVAEADLRAAKVNQTIGEITRDRTASEVLRDALTAYWESWYASAALDIQRRSMETARAQRDDANLRIESGSLAPADGLSFETQLASREEDVVTAQAEQGRRAADLRRLLGSVDRAVALAPGVAAPTPPELTSDIRREALLASPDIRELLAQLELARVQAETAGDTLRPRIDLDGYVEAQGLGYADVPAAVKQVGQLGAVSAHVGLTFELPLDDRRHRAERGRAELAIETASQKLEETRQRVLADVDTSQTAEASARRRVELGTQTLAVAERQLAAEQARYRTGGSTALQVLQAGDAVRSAELRVARAEADVVQNHLALSHLTGRLLADVIASGHSPVAATSCSRWDDRRAAAITRLF